MKKTNACFEAMMMNDIGISEAMDLILTNKIYENSSRLIKLHAKDIFDIESQLSDLYKDTRDKHAKDYYWRTREVLEKISSKTETQIELIYRIMLVAGHTLIPFFGADEILKCVKNAKSNYNFRSRFLKCLDLLEDSPTKFANLSDRKFVNLMLNEFGESMESFWEYSSYLRYLPNRTIFARSRNQRMPLSWIFATFSINRSWTETQRIVGKNYAAIIGQYPYLTIGKADNGHGMGVTINYKSKQFGVFLIKNIPRPPNEKDELTECLLTEFFLWYARNQLLKGRNISKIKNPFYRINNVSTDFAKCINTRFLGKTE